MLKLVQKLESIQTSSDLRAWCSRRWTAQKNGMNELGSDWEDRDVIVMYYIH